MVNRPKIYIFANQVFPPSKKSMNLDTFRQTLLKNFPFTPTKDQANAIDVFCQFLFDKNHRTVMIMRGSAGTGKTLLASEIVRSMDIISRGVALLAPTGRAAKVFSSYADAQAYTIHRKIYRQKSFSDGIGHFVLGENLFKNVLFLIDEASMISDKVASDSTPFGSGNLLGDLISFIYKGKGCRMMLIGDKAQLPPVGQSEAAALNPEVLSSYNLKVYSCDLDEVLRQATASGILFNATLIRRMVNSDEESLMPKIFFKGFADIEIVSGSDLIESLINSYREVGEDETIVVTRSNKWANKYNQGIRSTVFDREEEMTSGDLIMISRNNYYWTSEDSAGASVGSDDTSKIEFIANGDRARIKHVRNLRELYGFHFVDAWLEFPDYDNIEVSAILITDSLYSEAPGLTPEQSKALYVAVLEDYKDIASKKGRQDKMRQNPYYNALQVKYAYAVTCHKAQGGQWSHVYLYQGYMAKEMYTKDYIHWLYTAFTRAKDKLFLVSWPKTQANDIKDE